MPSSNESDADLVRRAEGGCADAKARILERVRLATIAALSAADVTMAEDIAQDVCVFLLEQSHKYDITRGTLESWARGIARHKLQAAVLREQRHKRADIVEFEEQMRTGLFCRLPTPDVESDWLERIEAAKVFLAGCPPQMQSVVELRYVHCQTNEEIAYRVGIKRTTVTEMLSRFHRALREHLGRRWPPEDWAREVS